MDTSGVDDVRGKFMGAMVGPDQDVVLDTSNAVLLDGLEVCLVGPPRDATSDQDILLAMRLDGRVNKSPDRASIMFLFDEDGAATIISELLALATRIGPAFATALMARLEALQSEPSDE
jgi:hypothetical protein